MTAIHAFDGRQAVLVDPHEIVVGDFMRDCGRLREVEMVEPSSGLLTPGVLVRFTDDQDGVFATLSIPSEVGVVVTVWRVLDQPDGACRVAA